MNRPFSPFVPKMIPGAVVTPSSIKATNLTNVGDRTRVAADQTQQKKQRYRVSLGILNVDVRWRTSRHSENQTDNATSDIGSDESPDAADADGRADPTDDDRFSRD
jgi:hypothetical protein